MSDQTRMEGSDQDGNGVLNEQEAPHHPLGKNEARREFCEAWRAGRLGQLLDFCPGDDIFFLVVSVAGSDMGRIYWPLTLSGDRWLLCDAKSLKSQEPRLRIKRKNPCHVAYFLPGAEEELICSSERLRAKLSVGNLSNLTGNWLPSEVENRILCLPIAAYMEEIEKEWRRQNFVSLEMTSLPFEL